MSLPKRSHESSTSLPGRLALIEYPPQPTRDGLDTVWQKDHGALHAGVIKALMVLPDDSCAEISIAGIEATDLFGLNTALGAAIEKHVVQSLNKLRGVWDPTGRYATYSLIRHSQSFPDVRLED